VKRLRLLLVALLLWLPLLAAAQQTAEASDAYQVDTGDAAIDHSCRDSVKAWSRTVPDEGEPKRWADVIKGLPTAPTNLHWRALRYAIVASHDHWDRPITLDATLKRQLGDRAQRDRAASEQ